MTIHRDPIFAEELNNVVSHAWEEVTCYEGFYDPDDHQKQAFNAGVALGLLIDKMDQQVVGLSADTAYWVGIFSQLYSSFFKQD